MCARQFSYVITEGKLLADDALDLGQLAGHWTNPASPDMKTCESINAVTELFICHNEFYRVVARTYLLSLSLLTSTDSVEYHF